MIDWKEILLTPTVQALRTGNNEVSRRIDLIFFIQKTIAGLMESIEADQGRVADCKRRADEYEAKSAAAKQKISEAIRPGAATPFTTVERRAREQLHLQWSNEANACMASANYLRNTADSILARIAANQADIVGHSAEQERQWAVVSRQIPFGVGAVAAPSATPVVTRAPAPIGGQAPMAGTNSEVIRLATAHQVPRHSIAALGKLLAMHPTKGEAIAAAISAGRLDSEIADDLAANRI